MHIKYIYVNMIREICNDFDNSTNIVKIKNNGDDKMNIEQIYYYATDKVKLTGLIYKSKEPTKKILISTHGMVTNCLKKRDETIARKLTENNIDHLIYNNRGHDVITYIYKENEKKERERILSGTAYEDVEEGYNDILGTIKYVLNKGYEEIYLQGHSLGATKHYILTIS